MKAFWISVALFLVMLAMVVGSMVMNRHVSGSMRALMEALPESPAPGATDALESFWGAWRAWMRPTMSQTTWRSVNDLVVSLGAYAMLGEQGTPEYAGARRQLACAIEEMSRPERAALQSLL